MTQVRVDPLGESTHQISLADGVREFGIRLSNGPAGVEEGPAEANNVLTGGQAKFGDFDPSMAHIEMRDWTRGRGYEELAGNEGGYFDAQAAWTITPERAFQAPQWQISSGLREDSRLLPGNVTWQPLLGDQLYISANFTPTTAIVADKAFLWVRRIGSPAAGTFEMRSNSGASSTPATVTQTVSLTTTMVPDVISQWQVFDWSGTTSISSATKMHLDLAGAATDNQANHWEIGVSTASTAAHTSSNGTVWSQAAFQPYFRVVDADRARKMSMFRLGSSAWFAWSQHDNGSSASNLYRLSSATTQWTAADFSSGGGLSSVVAAVWEDVAVISSIAAVAQGPSSAIRYLRVSGSSVDMRADGTSTNVADRLHVFYDPVDGPQLWRANSSLSLVSRSNIPAWAANSTFTPSTSVPIGNQSLDIIEITDHDDQIYVRKQDSVWSVRNDRAARIPVGIDAVTETADYLPMLSKDLDLLFSWSHSLEALSGRTLTDIGPWRGAGLPSSRAGTIVALEPGIGMLFCGMDAGTTGVSSVLALTDAGYHEVFRAPSSGMRVQSLKWQARSGASPRLWVGCGGELYYLTFARDNINLLRDPTIVYQHEAVIESATIDMGLSHLPKLFSEVSANTQNLNSSGIEVHCEYQIDEDVGGSSWVSVGRFLRSPQDSLAIRRGDKHRIRLRFRLLTSIATTPTILVAAVLKAAARTPLKRKWTVRALSGTFQVTATGLPDHAPDEFYLWLQDAAVTTIPLHMRSVWRALDDQYVYALPPAIQRTYTTPDGSWGAEFVMQLREI